MQILSGTKVSTSKISIMHSIYEDREREKKEYKCKNKHLKK